jgi:hypothetical protein
VIHGVGADGERGLHHQARLVQHLLARVLLQEIAQEVAADREAEQHHDEQAEIELQSQRHSFSSFLLVETPGPWTIRAT